MAPFFVWRPGVCGQNVRAGGTYVLNLLPLHRGLAQ